MDGTHLDFYNAWEDGEENDYDGQQYDDNDCIAMKAHVGR